MEAYTSHVYWLLEKGAGRADVERLRDRFTTLPFVYERLHEREPRDVSFHFEHAGCSYAYVFFVDLEKDVVESVTIHYDGHTLDLRVSSGDRPSDFDFGEILCMKHL